MTATSVTPFGLFVEIEPSWRYPSALRQVTFAADETESIAPVALEPLDLDEDW